RPSRPCPRRRYAAFRDHGRRQGCPRLRRWPCPPPRPGESDQHRRPRLGRTRLAPHRVVRMTAGILKGLRVVEGSAFVAAPLGGMTLAQLGADVIRFDQIGGGLDAHRWPLGKNGESLFWAGLNKGKRSIQIDLRSKEGQEIASALIASGGDDGGIFLTNFPARGWLAYEALKA